MRARRNLIPNTASMLAGLAIEDIVQAWPWTVRVFARRRMACVGCEVAALHKLEDAARAYGIPVGDLIRDLREPAVDGANPGHWPC